MIKLSSNKQVSSVVVAKFGFGLGFLSILVLWSEIPAANLIAVALLVATMALGIFAVELAKEPSYVVEMEGQNLIYRHKRGALSLDVNNIQRCDHVTINDFSGRRNTGYIGFRLKDSTDLIQSIPLRLASRLLIEQKDLQVVAGKEQCATGACNLDAVIDKIEWKSPTGEVFQGVVGMFANRTQVLRKNLGFDFYISNQSFNEPAETVVNEIQKFIKKTEPNLC